MAHLLMGTKEDVDVTFSAKAKGYESYVVVNALDPREAGTKVAEWLEMQLRYLAVIHPGDEVQVTRKKGRRGNS